ncbi:PAS domain S-box protein [Geomonas sp. Red32]|uniref:PAS domain S-box protein n=1 Tax=Geomonas sp. Red32 TaxID=2912856 RepID=UPI00202CAA91|nr:PAS domain S-box protein [Geomonas sp. Red32]MCM0080135.1 PAS domain S-box protein [Geomonas sp. Red32]
MSHWFPNKRLCLVILGAFVLFWLTDATIDAVTFGHESFWIALRTAEPRELYMRTTMAAMLSILFAAYQYFRDRKRQDELALKHSDELSRLFIESTKDAILVINPRGLQVTSLNEVFLTRYGLTRKTATGKEMPWLIEQGYLPEEFLAMITEAAATGSSLTREITYLRAGGDRHYEEVQTHPIGDLEQGIDRICQVSRDVTVRRTSESLLRESEARYRAIFENTGTALAIVLPDGTLRMVNREFEAMTGFSRNELEAKKRWTEFLAPGQEEIIHQQYGGLSHGDDAGQLFEICLVNGFGTVRTMTGSWAPIAGTEEAVLSLVDITSQKHIEKELRESQATLALAQRISRLGNWEWDVTTDTITWSEEMFHMFDVEPGTFKPSFDYFIGVVHPDDRDTVVRAVNEALYNRKPYHLDYRLVLPGGVIRTHSARGEVSYDAQGNPLRMVGTNQDVTWRMEAEQALRVSEEKFSKAFRASPDSIVITRAEDGMYIDVNEAFQEITGYTRDEVIGKTSMELELWAEPEARMVMLRLLNQFGHVRNLDVKFRVKSGEIRELLWSAEVIEYRNEACLIAISRDVTDQRHLEKELLESDARLFMKHEELKNLFHQMEGIRREWEEIMDSISDMFILADHFGKIRRFNRALEDFTRLAHRDLVGRDWLELLEEHGLKAHLQAPGVELPHEGSGKRFVLNRYPLPTPEIDGSVREVIIINDTSRIRLRHTPTHLRLATPRQDPH